MEGFTVDGVIDLERKIFISSVYCLTSNGVVLHKKDVPISRTGVPVQSPLDVSCHVDVVP